MRARSMTGIFALGVVAGLALLAGGCSGGDGGGGDSGPGPNAQTAYEVREGQSATIRVARVSGVSGSVQVSYSVVAGTATHLADYGDPSGLGTLAWPSGSGGVLTFSVPIVDDGVAEGPETVLIRLSSATGGATIATAEATLTIRDPPQRDVLRFSAPEYTAYEKAGSTTATFTVERLDPGSGTVTVAYAVASGGTATAGADFGAPSGTGTLSWSPYDGSARTFTVPVLDDGGPNEGVETVLLGLSSPTGGAVLGSPSTATLSIVDAAGAVRFASPTYSTEEGSVALVRLERVGGARGTVTAAYSVARGTASLEDFTASSVPTSVTWTDGDTSAKTFTVLASNDAPGDEPDETVLLSMTGDVTAPSTATLTITDRPGALSFAYERMGVYETLPYVPVPVKRTGGSRGAVSVTCATSDGSAIAGTHYTATSTTLSWTSGDAGEKSCPVQILDDGVALDGDQILNLSLSAPTGGATLGVPPASTLTIMDGAGAFRFVP